MTNADLERQDRAWNRKLDRVAITVACVCFAVTALEFLMGWWLFGCMVAVGAIANLVVIPIRHRNVKERYLQ